MKQLWKQTVMGIIWGLVVMMACEIITSITAIITAAGALVGSGETAVGFGALTIIFFLGVIAGFVWFFINLSKFIPMQKNDTDRAAISNVRLAYIIFIVGAVLAFIPVAGWIICLICDIAAYIILLLGFNSYSTSKALNETGRQGANLLKIYAILVLICAILAIIPFVNIIAIIGEIVALVLLFMGWSKVSVGIDE